MSLLEDKSPKRTPLSELGEFGLIEHVSVVPSFSVNNQEIGDDCAVDWGDKYGLITTRYVGRGFI